MIGVDHEVHRADPERGEVRILVVDARFEHLSAEFDRFRDIADQQVDSKVGKAAPVFLGVLPRLASRSFLSSREFVPRAERSRPQHKNYFRIADAVSNRPEASINAPAIRGIGRMRLVSSIAFIEPILTSR
jgi:hypothetical protein